MWSFIYLNLDLIFTSDVKRKNTINERTQYINSRQVWKK